MNVIAKISCYFERTEIAQRIFKYSGIQYTRLTPDKILNNLVYRTLFYVNMYGSFDLSKKTVRFFGPPCNYIYLCISDFKVICGTRSSDVIQQI